MTISRNAKTLVVEAPAGSFYPVLRINVGEPLRLPRRQRASEVVLHWTLTVVALTLRVITVLLRFRSDAFQRIRSWLDVLPLSAVDSIARKISDPHLIVFDRVSLMILGAAAAVFLLCSGLKLHGSSSAFWDFYIAGKKPQTGVLLGEPKLFRMDEWSVFTPNIFSQIYSKPAFSATNQSVGGGTTVLFWSSPVNHFSELPRFHLWAFHFLPEDFAFSVYWNLKGLILFIGTFLLLMLLTGSRPLLSGTGALWIYFCSITQWWFSHCLPEAIGFGSLTLVAGAYLILTRKGGLLWTAAIALIIAALNFALIFYPPFTIPVMWVMVCTGIGVFWERRKLLTGEDPLRLRWLLLSCSLLCILATIGGVLRGYARHYQTHHFHGLSRQPRQYRGRRISCSADLQLDRSDIYRRPFSKVPYKCWRGIELSSRWVDRPARHFLAEAGRTSTLNNRFRHCCMSCWILDFFPFRFS